MPDIQLADVFVEMADTLVDDFDVIDFMQVLTERCVQLLGVSAAGLLLTDQRDTLQVVAASSERTRLLELFQLQTDQGPCVDCFRTGTTSFGRPTCPPTADGPASPQPPPKSASPRYTPCPCAYAPMSSVR